MVKAKLCPVLIFNFLLLSFCLSQNLYSAEDPQVTNVVDNNNIIITEFMPNPEGENEWVEVFNNSELTLNLVGWHIGDNTTSLKDINITIDPNSYGVVDLKTNRFLNNDDGDSVRLVDSNGDEIYSLKYENSEKGLSIALVNGNWIFSNPTKGEKNFVEEVIEEEQKEEEEKESYPDNILITEFFACPNSGDSEWIELYNENDFKASLVGWKVDDVDGGSSPKIFSADIDKKSYYKVEYSGLNNSGDEVRLLNPDGDVVDNATYGGCLKGFSHALSKGIWSLTLSTTPGEENIIALPQEEEEKDDSLDKETDKKIEDQSPPESFEEVGEVLGISSFKIERALPQKFGFLKEVRDQKLSYGNYKGVVLEKEAKKVPLTTVGGFATFFIALTLLFI